MIEVLDRPTVRSWLSDGAQLVDVLPPAQYEEVHLQGALNLPLKVLDTAPGILDPARPVVVYCSNYL